MKLRIIAIAVALSVLASAHAAAAEGAACDEMMRCCMQGSAAAQPCPDGTRSFERTCCCSIAPMAPATTSPSLLAVERSHEQAPPLYMYMASAAATAASADRGTRQPRPADRGPPPAARSLFAQHIALLL